VTQFDIRMTRYGSRVATELTTAALADLSERYGGEGDSTPIQPGEFDPPEGAFLVAYVDHVPAGCAGYRTLAEDETTAELKRMYVAPQARGRGIAARLLAQAEHTATALGHGEMRLETAVHQPEAIELYTHAGYTPIRNYPPYQHKTLSRCYAKPLPLSASGPHLT